jgi:hypothetical protein
MARQLGWHEMAETIRPWRAESSNEGNTMNELTDEQITSIAYDCNALPEVVTDETLAIFACAVIAADRALQNDAWRKAIDDARLSLMLDITAPDANPAASVKELVSWANELALNPAISSEAQALIDRGLAIQSARHAEELLAYEVTVGNLRAQREQVRAVAWMSPKNFYRTRAMGLSNGEQLLEPLYLHPAVPPAQPERKPMTESEMLEGRERTFSVDNPYCPCDRKTFMKVARYVEAFHGIFGGKP